MIAETWGSLEARCTEVRLGAAAMIVEQVHPGNPHAASYQELWDNTPIARGVRLEFDSPLKLLALGRYSVLPIPRYLWDWYACRWQAFSGGIDLPPEFSRWVEWQVHVTETRLETCYAYMEKLVEWKGVIGQVAYHGYWDERDPVSRYPDYLRAWQVLARLSEFSGTGEKTTMGMGRTRYLKAEGLLSSNPDGARTIQNERTL